MEEEPENPSENTLSGHTDSNTNNNTITFEQVDTTPQPDQPHRRSRWRGCLVWLIVGIVATIGVIFYLRYLNPYITDARERVYIERVEKRGIIFKTYEVQVVSPDMLNNSVAAYKPAESFSVANDSLAIRLQDMQNTGQIVTITYERFYGILPWRGASHNVITGIDQ